MEMEALSGPKGPGLQWELEGRLSVLTPSGLVLSFLSPEEGFRLSFLSGSETPSPTGEQTSQSPCPPLWDGCSSPGRWEPPSRCRLAPELQKQPSPQPGPRPPRLRSPAALCQPQHPPATRPGTYHVPRYLLCAHVLLALTMRLGTCHVRPGDQIRRKKNVPVLACPLGSMG